eukprot:Opistho-1_new@47853
MFASGSLDGTIVLWSCAALVPLSTIPVQGTQRPPRVVPDTPPASDKPQPKAYTSAVQFIMTHAQRYLFAAIGTNFAVYDIQLGDWVVRSAQAHRHQVLGMALVLNGTRLVTCSADWTLRLWGPEGSADYSKAADPYAFGFPSPSVAAGFAMTAGPFAPSTPPRDALAMDVAGGVPSSVRPFVGTHPSSVQEAPLPPFPGGGAGGTGLSRPVCHGEMLAHADVVNAVLPVGDGAFASCGSDGAVVLWKDGLAEARKRAELVRMVHGIIAASTRPLDNSAPPTKP